MFTEKFRLKVSCSNFCSLRYNSYQYLKCILKVAITFSFFKKYILIHLSRILVSSLSSKVQYDICFKPNNFKAQYLGDTLICSNYMLTGKRTFVIRHEEVIQFIQVIQLKIGYYIMGEVLINFSSRTVRKVHLKALSVLTVI